MRRVLPLLLPPVLALMLFGYALALPPFLDDGNLYLMIHDYQEVGVHGLRFWTGSAAYQYYRPLGFTVMELAYGADAAWNVWALHAFNLLVYAATALGVAVLTQRVSGSRWAGVIGGCAFVLYPYTYRSVTWIAALFHVMVAAGVVWALVGTLWWMDGRRGALAWAGVLLATAWALFSQEAGLLVGPLVLLTVVLVYGWGVLARRRLWALLLPIGALTGGFLLIYFNVPRPAAGPLTLYHGMLPGSLAVFAQGFAYPFFAAVNRLGGEFAVPRTLPMLALGAGVVMLGVWMAGAGRRRAAVLGVLCFGGLALPALLLTPTDYVKGSPHILTTAAVGMGVFWGAALSGALARGRALPMRALAVLVMLGGVGVSLAFNAARQAEAQRQADYVMALYALVGDEPDGVALVNPPAFLGAYAGQRWFLTGSEATMFMQRYSNYGLLFRAMTGRSYPDFPAYLVIPAFAPPPSYEYAPLWTDDNLDAGYISQRLVEARRVIITRMEGDRFWPEAIDGADWPDYARQQGWE